MPFPVMLSATVGMIILILASLFVYSSQQIMRLPGNTPENFLKQARPPSGRPVVVCAGASMVHGRVGVNFVDLLSSRFPDCHFINAGYNGDTALHLSRRLAPIIACRPDAIAILVGTNDAIGTIDTTTWQRYQGEKRLDGPPSLENYRVTMQEIVRTLKQKTAARIALCSLPVLGEDLESLPNQRVSEFNAVICEVAAQESVAYLPVFERETAALNAHQQATHTTGQVFSSDFSVYGRIMFFAALQHYLLGRSFDEVSRRGGMLLKTDLIHGNSLESGIIAAEVESFLKSVLSM